MSRFDIDSAVDRLMFVNGWGHLLGLPTRPGTSSAATTGIPTNGILGFAPGALFYNFKSTTLGTRLYVNVGNNGYTSGSTTNQGALWSSLDAGSLGLLSLASSTITLGASTTTATTIPAAKAFAGEFSDLVITGGSTTAAVTATLDSTANLLAQVPPAETGDVLRLRVMNNETTTITLAAGDASTVVNGSATIGSGKFVDFDALVSGSSITINSAGQGSYVN